MIAAATCSSSAATIADPSGGGGSANISISGDVLTITLSDSVAVSQNGSVLTALFFNVAGNRTLTPVSALGPTTQSGYLGWTMPDGFNGNVGGEWRYDGGGSVLAYGASQGISSTGLGVFGPTPNFGGSDLNNNANGNIDGGDFGIVGPNSVQGLGNISDAVIEGSVTFSLSGATGLSASDITDLTFQYGTSLNNNSVPDGGATIALLGFALLGLHRLRRYMFS